MPIAPAPIEQTRAGAEAVLGVDFSGLPAGTEVPSKKIKDELDKGKSTKDVLRIVETGEQDQKRIDQFAEARIRGDISDIKVGGTGLELPRDPGGVRHRGETTPDHPGGKTNVQRHTELTKSLTEINKLLVGYDSLPAGEKLTARTNLQTALIAYWPDAAAIITAYDTAGLTAEKQAFLENILRSQEFLGKMKEQLTTMLDSDKYPASEVNAELATKYKEAEKELDDKEAARLATEKTADDAKKEWETYDLSTGVNRVQMGVLEADIRTNNRVSEAAKAKPAYLAALRTREDAKNTLDQYLRTAKTPDPTLVGTLRGDFATADGELKRAEADYREHQDKIDELQELRTKAAQAQQTYNTAKSAFDTAVRDKGVAETKFKAAQKAYDDMIENIYQAESQLVRDAEQLYSKAVQEYSKEQGRVGEERRREEEKASKEATKESNKTAAVLALETRWNTDKGGNKKKEINDDFDALMKGGPEGLRAALKFDTDQWAAVKDDALVGIVQKKLQIGGMTQQMSDRIVQSKWMDDLYGKAKAGNAKLEAEWKTIHPDKKVGYKSALTFIRDQAKRHPGLARLALLTLVGIAVPPGWLAALVGAGAFAVSNFAHAAHAAHYTTKNPLPIH